VKLFVWFQDVSSYGVFIWPNGAAIDDRPKEAGLFKHQTWSKVVLPSGNLT